MKTSPVFVVAAAAVLGSAIRPVLAQPAPRVAYAATVPVVIGVDATANRHAISPLIYGVAHADANQLAALNSPINRSGGNNTTRYNWQLNADNRAMDYFFESIAEDSAVPADRADSFIARSKAAGAQAMWTIPIIDWIAKVGPNREKLASFSVAKYGAQQSTDPYMPDAGNGVKTNGAPVTGNDPNDANVRNSPTFEKGLVQHLVQKWGTAANGGLKYYLLDNEPAIWYGTHRDVQPVGVHMQDFLNKTTAYSTAIKAADPSALVAGPEEWGWSGYLYSGYDSQNAASLGYDSSKFADRKLMGGQDAMPYYLDQLRRYSETTGKRALDLFTVHFYPQGGEFGSDVSEAMQLRRNRSTRSLWDPAYTDETWINDKVQLVPRLKKWVADNYPNTPVGITEYNWGAENHINGATTQADILGIFGREGLDLAARWVTPPTNSLVFKAMQMYRNYDGRKGTFGETSVRATAPNPDEISAFAALRQSDGALTIMVVNKKLVTGSDKTTAVTLDIKNFTPFRKAQLWQLTSTNTIRHATDVSVPGGKITMSLANQTVNLFVIPGSSF